MARLWRDITYEEGYLHAYDTASAAKQAGHAPIAL